jgi:FMN-dependent NADH-azoreductase
MDEVEENATVQRRVLIVQSSGRHRGGSAGISNTHLLVEKILARLTAHGACGEVTRRDATLLPFIDDDFMLKSLNPLKNTPEAPEASDARAVPSMGDSTEEKGDTRDEKEEEEEEEEEEKEEEDNAGNRKETSPWEASCACITQLKDCDILVLAYPCYNFTIPASLKVRSTT